MCARAMNKQTQKIIIKCSVRAGEMKIYFHVGEKSLKLYARHCVSACDFPTCIFAEQ